MVTAGRAISLGGRWLFRLVGGLLLLLLLILAIFRIAASSRETETGIPPESTIIATPLGGVAVQLAGPAEGPPVVLVHGTAGWSGFWRNISAHLARAGWRVIAVDLPPFGYSDRDPLARYDRAAQAVRLAAVIGRAAGRPAVVVGHSFGSGAVVELALRHPDWVRAVTLVDAALGEIDPLPATRGAAGWALNRSWTAQPLTSAVITNPLLTGPLLRSMIARRDSAAAWVDTIRQPMRREGTTAAYAAWLPNLFATDDGAVSRRSANLRRIRPPVSLIWGEADTVTPIAQGEAIARLTGARSFIRLPGLAHIPHIEDESAFLDALDRSIRGAGGR